MGRREEWGDDDGRVIADMSGIERPRLFFPRAGKTAEPPDPPRQKGNSGEERGWREEGQALTPQERRIYIFAALKAALLIALAFIAGLGLAVWIMLWIWT